MSLSALDLWRLVDHFNVLDAAVLIAGGEPSYFRANEGHATEEFRAEVATVETALRRAILKSALRAELAFAAEGYLETDFISETMEPVETWRAIVSAVLDERLALYTGRGLPSLSDLQALRIRPEPDWENTLIAREDLVDWLSKRSVFPECFLGDRSTEGPKDKRHPRYSEKLTCAVSAWEEIESAAPSKSVKQTISAWVRSHANHFNLVDDEGRPIENAVEEIAKVVNWNPKGGATPTSLGGTSEGEKEPPLRMPVENFQRETFEEPDDYWEKNPF